MSTEYTDYIVRTCQVEGCTIAVCTDPSCHCTLGHPHDANVLEPEYPRPPVDWTCVKAWAGVYVLTGVWAGVLIRLIWKLVAG